MITKMITSGRFTDSILPPGTASSNTIFTFPSFLPSYPTPSTRPLYYSASTLSTQFRRIHSRSFFQNQTVNAVPAPLEALDTTTRIILYILFFIMSCCALFSLAHFLNYIFRLQVTKLQQRYNYQLYGEFEGLITRRISLRYCTFDVTSPHDAEENGQRPVSSTRSTENLEFTSPVDDTKATKATDAINAAKAVNAVNAIKTAKVTEATKSVKVAEGTKAVKVAEGTKAVKVAEATKATKAINAINAIKTAKVTEATKSVKFAEATKSVKVAEGTKAVKVAEATKAARSLKATKVTRATKPTKPIKATKSTKTPEINHNEPEWESAQPSHPTTPTHRKVAFANFPRPIRRPPTSKQPAAAGIKSAASPPRASRQNRPNPVPPPKRIRSPPLSPDFLTISNATTAPMAIPGQEPASWIAGLPWATAADGPNTRDEGKEDREMDPDDENWGDIDRIISNGRDQYASDKKVLDAASRKDREVKRESGLNQSRDECNNCSTSSEGFWAY